MKRAHGARCVLLMWLQNKCVSPVRATPLNNHQTPFRKRAPTPILNTLMSSKNESDLPAKKSDSLWKKPKTRVWVVVGVETFALSAHGVNNFPMVAHDSNALTCHCLLFCMSSLRRIPQTVDKWLTCGWQVVADAHKKINPFPLMSCSYGIGQAASG